MLHETRGTHMVEVAQPPYYITALNYRPAKTADFQIKKGGFMEINGFQFKFQTTAVYMFKLKITYNIFPGQRFRLP